MKFPNSQMKVFLEAAMVTAVFFGAVWYRLWFITLVPQPVIYDQDEYQWYATKIYYHPQMLASHSYRSYPFPLMLATVYKFAGFADYPAVYTVNAVLDSLTAVGIYFLLRFSVRQKPAAWTGLLLYAVNPFTAGYVGVLLSEILDAFFITYALVYGYLFVKRKHPFWGLLLGFFAGMAAETRNSAFIWAAVPLFLTLFFIPFKKHLLAYAAVIIGMVITVLYPLYTNWRDYRELSISKVDSFYAMEFFNGATLKILPPFTKMYPVDQLIMWREYWSEFYPDRTTRERRALAKKYFLKGWEVVKSDPVDYVRWRFYKMWYVWQKENIFFYEEPGWQDRRYIVYSGNLALLGLAAAGIFLGRIMMRDGNRRYIWMVLVGTILYGMVAFSFSHAEYRLSIPFYPVIITLSAVGISGIWQLSNRIISFRK
ncbi:hypothetical protein A2Z33_07065 [Candidatus Gottesmanbacteria bacterium RBG_16_52_11]|uniref:Glycosyltransferase RgtA/B/C/D-like domain-containing protein n=1 Tax=Candidatus Gottesmanbacteria bacterium RBG_16_52_11 TaxID=1798374 RepID=A0A1F5YXU6_9BACT|nr:MAG: hypothetical protein A2Z33_07065 [Candidatus Gottesmanbacteria bacterium RBG_16_52_11]